MMKKWNLSFSHFRNSFVFKRQKLLKQVDPVKPLQNKYDSAITAIYHIEDRSKLSTLKTTYVPFLKRIPRLVPQDLIPVSEQRNHTNHTCGFSTHAPKTSIFNQMFNI